MDGSSARRVFAALAAPLVFLSLAASLRAQSGNTQARILDMLRKTSLGTSGKAAQPTTSTGTGAFSRKRFPGLRRLRPRPRPPRKVRRRALRTRIGRSRPRRRRRYGARRGGGNFTCAGCGKASHVGENVKKRVDACTALVKRLLDARPDVDGYLDNRDFCTYCGGRIAGSWEKALVLVVREPKKGRVPVKEDVLTEALAIVEGGKPAVGLPKGLLKRLDKLIDLDRKLDAKQKAALRKRRAETKKAAPEPSAGAIGLRGAIGRRRIHFRRKIVYGPKGKRRVVFTPQTVGGQPPIVFRGTRPPAKGSGGVRRVRKRPFGAPPIIRSRLKLRRHRRRGFAPLPPAAPTGPIRFVCSRCGKGTVFTRDATTEALERDLAACEDLVVQLRLEHPELDLDMDSGSLCRDCNPKLKSLLKESLGDRFTFKGKAPKLLLNVRAPRVTKVPVDARLLQAVLRLFKDEPLRDRSLEKAARAVAKTLDF